MVVKKDKWRGQQCEYDGGATKHIVETGESANEERLKGKGQGEQEVVAQEEGVEKSEQGDTEGGRKTRSEKKEAAWGIQSKAKDTL